MALIDTIKYGSVSDNELVWKYPRDDFKIGSQLIVNESQDAIFVKGGHVLDSFEAGTHTITTGNIPLLEKIINLPFGKNTPFTAEVWYINKTVKRDLKWGTPQTIQVMDKSLNYPVSVRAFGSWVIIWIRNKLKKKKLERQAKAEEEKPNKIKENEKVPS